MIKRKRRNTRKKNNLRKSYRRKSYRRKSYRRKSYRIKKMKGGSSPGPDKIKKPDRRLAFAKLFNGRLASEAPPIDMEVALKVAGMIEKEEKKQVQLDAQDLNKRLDEMNVESIKSVAKDEFGITDDEISDKEKLIDIQKKYTETPVPHDSLKKSLIDMIIAKMVKDSGIF